MYKNKRGISGVITMLIIIALVLVAIGVVWYVIQNILEQGQEETEQASGDIFNDCEVDAGGTTMVNETYPTCSGEVRIVGGEYCCI